MWHILMTIVLGLSIFFIRIFYVWIIILWKFGESFMVLNVNTLTGEYISQTGQTGQFMRD